MEQRYALLYRGDPALIANSVFSQFARASTIDLWSGRYSQEEKEVKAEHKPASRVVRRVLDWVV